MAARWDLLILAVLIAALTLALDRAAAGSVAAWRTTDALRRGLLLDPEAAIRGFCDAAAARPPAPCDSRLRWRRDAQFVDVCLSAEAVSPLSPGSGSTGAAFRPRRYYDLQTRCLWRLGPWRLALPLLRAQIFR